MNAQQGSRVMKMHLIHMFGLVLLLVSVLLFASGCGPL
jgi:hypothetical protein